MKEIQPEYKVCPHCGRAVRAEVPVHHLLPGTILGGKILVGTSIGEGGFGITYIGRDLNLDIRVAVKEYFPNGYVNRSNTASADVSHGVSEGNKDFFLKGKERFVREARILAQFSSEHGVVEVRDFFEENNTAYIIMEYLDGQDLKSYLAANGTLTPSKTLELLLPVMRTMTKIHGQGLIHRDISPDNIRLSGEGIKLLDFGAARSVSSIANKSLSVMLKPGYAPEEQYRSKGEQGPWTDVYALCATMYKCITGITPDDATQRVFRDDVKPPSALGIAIDKGFENTLMRGMAVLQKDRVQSMSELIRGFTSARSSASSRAAAVPPAPSAKAAKEKKPTVREVSFGAKVLSAFLTVIMLVLVFAISVIGVLRSSLSEENLSSSVDSVDFVEVSWGGVPFGEAVCDGMDPDLREYLCLDEEAVEHLADEGVVSEYLVDSVSCVTDHVIFGKRFRQTDQTYYADFIKSNSKELYEATDHRFDADMKVDIEGYLAENYEFSDSDLKGMEEKYGFDFSVASTLVSPGMFWGLLAVLLLLLVAVFRLNNWRIGAILNSVQVAALFSGVLLGAAGLTCLLIPVFLDEFVLLAVSSVFMVDCLLAGAILLAVGLIPPIVWRLIDKNKKKSTSDK